MGAKYESAYTNYGIDGYGVLARLDFALITFKFLLAFFIKIC